MVNFKILNIGTNYYITCLSCRWTTPACRTMRASQHCTMLSALATPRLSSSWCSLVSTSMLQTVTGGESEPRTTSHWVQQHSVKKLKWLIQTSFLRFLVSLDSLAAFTACIKMSSLYPDCWIHVLVWIMSSYFGLAVTPCIKKASGFCLHCEFISEGWGLELRDQDST